MPPTPWDCSASGRRRLLPSAPAFCRLPSVRTTPSAPLPGQSTPTDPTHATLMYGTIGQARRRSSFCSSWPCSSAWLASTCPSCPSRLSIPMGLPSHDVRRIRTVHCSTMWASGGVGDCRRVDLQLILEGTWGGLNSAKQDDKLEAKTMNGYCIRSCTETNVARNADVCNSRSTFNCGMAEAEHEPRMGSMKWHAIDSRTLSWLP